MEISAFCNHLRHPLTYTDAKGRTKHLSSQEIYQVTMVVLFSLAVAAAEAIKSNRSLKSSFVSMGIAAGAMFYLATAIMKKMANRGDAPGSNEPKRGKDPFSPVKESNKILISVIGSPDKIEWTAIDHPPNSGSEQKRTETAAVSAEVKKEEAPRMQGPVTAKSSDDLLVSPLLVSELTDQRGWFVINNPPNSGSELQETEAVAVTAEVKKEEAPRMQEQVTDIAQTLEPSEDFPVIQDEVPNTLEVSAIGLSGKKEWVLVDDSSSFPGSEQSLYTNNLKDWELDKEGPQNFCSDGATIVERQGASESKNYETNPTLGKPDSSSCLCIVQEQKLYQQLTPSEEEVTVISEMIQMIGDTWVPMLLLKQGELIEMGKQIKNVHPLKFLETILNNPATKKSMLDIKCNDWKWKGFLNGDSSSPGFIAKCEKEDVLGNFAPYITDFCRAVKADSQKFLTLYKAKEWKYLISILIQI